MVTRRSQCRYSTNSCVESCQATIGGGEPRRLVPAASAYTGLDFRFADRPGLQQFRAGLTFDPLSWELNQSYVPGFFTEPCSAVRPCALPAEPVASSVR
jgi:hypothetical protein